MKPMYIGNFKSVLPKYRGEQAVQGVSWLAKAHARCQTGADSVDSEFSFLRILEKLVSNTNSIKYRYTELEDFFHNNWQKMKIYNLEHSIYGAGLLERMNFYRECVLKALESLYPSDSMLPTHILHVTCTGYLSPSPVQEFIQKKKSMESRYCLVKHVYHMGCYAALPAVDLAESLASKSLSGSMTRCDVFHSELCTLHLKPHLHNLEQLVIQSLFADGYIKYSVEGYESYKRNPQKGNRFQIIALHEVLIEGTLDMMTWVVSDNSFLMTLSRDLPNALSTCILKFCNEIFEKSNLNKNYCDIKDSIIYAIHPGGPKIIHKVCEVLGVDLTLSQHSLSVLENRGNMSSATLPHIWQLILDDPKIKEGTLVLSLAFGPGVTVSGALFRKE